MIQPGKRLNSPELERFLSEQPLTGSYTFTVHTPTLPPYDKTFQNDSEAYEFIENHPDTVYEFKFSTDYA